MAEKVAKLGLSRDSNFDYVVRSGAVWRVPRGLSGRAVGSGETEESKEKPEKVYDLDAEEDAAYTYFLDDDGDVAREKR